MTVDQQARRGAVSPGLLGGAASRGPGPLSGDPPLSSRTPGGSTYASRHQAKLQQGNSAAASDARAKSPRQQAGTHTPERDAGPRSGLRPDQQQSSTTMGSSFGSSSGSSGMWAPGVPKLDLLRVFSPATGAPVSAPNLTAAQNANKHHNYPAPGPSSGGFNVPATGMATTSGAAPHSSRVHHPHTHGSAASTEPAASHHRRASSGMMGGAGSALLLQGGSTTHMGGDAAWRRLSSAADLGPAALAAGETHGVHARLGLLIVTHVVKPASAIH
jgi:hypothetical protein